MIHESFERLAANADRAWRETLAIESLDRDARARGGARRRNALAGNARLEAIVAERRKTGEARETRSVVFERTSRSRC